MASIYPNVLGAAVGPAYTIPVIIADERGGVYLVVWSGVAARCRSDRLRGFPSAPLTDSMFLQPGPKSDLCFQVRNESTNLEALCQFKIYGS